MMNRITTYILSACFFLACTISCTKENPDSPQNSGDAIRFVTSTQETTTKAEIITPQNFTDEAKGGGNFTLDAYWVETETSQTATKYINNAWVWYFKDAEKLNSDSDPDNNIPQNRIWRFRQGDQVTEYYWPNNGALNFFAYMPMAGNLGNTGVTIGDYSVTTGPSFSANLPSTNTAADATTLTQNNLKEFIYAYTPNQTQNTGVNAGTDNTKGVGLQFVHPFSAIKLKLTRAHRMKLHSVAFKGIHLNGSYKHYKDDKTNTIGNWTYSDKTEDLTLTIEQLIPEDINYGVTFNGPNLVLPQIISNDATIEVKYTKAQTGNVITASVKLRQKDDQGSDIPGIPTSWAPGYAYTYALDLGDNLEEVLFNVVVEPWKKGEYGDYKNIIDVE